MQQKFHWFLLLFGIALSGPVLLAADDISLEYASPRTAYYRDENPVVPISVKGEFPAGATLQARMDAHHLETVPAQSGVREVAIPSRVFRSGVHRLTIRVADAEGKTLAERSFPLRLVKRPAPDALFNWLWMNGGPVDADFYREHGFDYVGGPMLPYSAGTSFRSIGQILDKALGRGDLISVVPNGGLWKREFTLFPASGEGVDYVNAARHGEKYYNPFSPIVARKQDAANREFMEIVKDYPNVGIAWTDMEVQDDLTRPNLNAEGRAKMEEELGFKEEDAGDPEYIAEHVIPDNDRKYRLLKYIFQGGNGVHAGLQRMAAMVKKYRPDMLVMTDPFRHVSLYNVYPGADIIHSWTYSNPDPKSMLYIEQLRAACKPLGQIPLQIVTLLNYPGMLDVPKLREKPPGPEKNPHEDWMGMGPDRVRETTWINLSRAPRFVGYFYGSEIDPVKYAADTHRIPPATSAAIREMAEKVFRPYGKMIRKLEISPRRMAVLNSQAAALYNRSPDDGSGSYAGYRTLPFQAILEMAHYNADVIFDESVEQGALDNYDVLFLPRADTLTQTVYEKIKAFQKRGGIVYSDQYLGPALDVAHKFDFDFSYLPKVSARANAMGETYAQWNDHVESPDMKTDFKKVLGVPAHKDQEIKEGYAKALKEVVSKKTPPVVDSDDPTVLFNLTEKNGTKYLFVINDKRTYDERTAKFKGILEKNVPQTTIVRIKDAGASVAYDMLKKTLLPVKRQGDTLTFPVELDALGGTIVALYPSPLEKLTVSAPAQGTLGRELTLDIAIRDAADGAPKGLQPIRVDILDPKGVLHEDSDWVCLEDGAGRVAFTPAWDDPAGEWKVLVTDLTAGLTTEARFPIQTSPSKPL